MNNFDVCLSKVFQDEGLVYSNTSGDNGGPTKYGITIEDVRLYVNKKATAEDVKSLTMDQAKTIYKSKYWDALGCDALASGVDYTCFDYGVNSGLGRPRKALERFKSLSGTELIDAINNERTAFLKSISTDTPKYSHNVKFRKGWLARVERVRNYSHYLSAQKKDVITGPASTVASGLTVWAAISQYVHNHPMIVIGSSVAIAVVIGTLIHLYKNRK